MSTESWDGIAILILPYREGTGILELFKHELMCQELWRELQSIGSHDMSTHS
jgi:hypothetical protein